MEPHCNVMLNGHLNQTVYLNQTAYHNQKHMPQTETCKTFQRTYLYVYVSKATTTILIPIVKYLEPR